MFATESPGFYFFMSPEVVTAWSAWAVAMTGLLGTIFAFILKVRSTSQSNSEGIKELRASQLEIKQNVSDIKEKNGHAN